jgi:hypothetical protein
MVQISKKKLAELLEIQKMYEAIKKIGQKNTEVKKAVEKTEVVSKMDKIIKGAKISLGISKSKEKKVMEEYKSIIPDFKMMQHAFNNTVLALEATEKHVPTNDDPEIFLNNMKNPVEKQLERSIRGKAGAKVQLVLGTQFVKQGEANEAMDVPIVCKVETLLKTNISNTFETMKNKIVETYHNILLKESNLVYNKIVYFRIRFATWNPFEGSSYVELPDRIRLTKAVINIKNEDNRCFEWCIARADNPKDVHPERIGDLKKILEQNKYNFDGIEFPVKITDVPKFEKLNNRSINVFTCTKKGVVQPLYLSNKDYQNAVDLLLYNQHYALIKNFNRLNSNKTNHKEVKYICKRCMTHFQSQNKLDDHVKDCENFDYTKIVMPKEEDKFYKFKNYNKTMRVPFSIHCDFECLTAQVIGCNKENQKTTKYQNHIPSQVGMVLVSDDKDFQIEPFFYSGENAHDVLLQKLADWQPMIVEKLKQNKEMVLTKNEEKEFNEAINCNICKKELGNDRVRDHDHMTGKYRGACHNGCNLTYKVARFIPVIFHNLKGYDSHFILQKANDPKYGFKNIKAIPLNKEKFVSFEIDKYRFLDSFQFMSSSLESLVKNLKDGVGLEAFKITKKYFGEDKLELVTRKGVCPYDYLDSFEKFNDTRLPSKKAFYSKLNDSEIKDSEYLFAKLLWKKFECKTLKDYLELYLKVDVFTQADVFEAFRRVCMKNYGLDPLHYYTAPGLAWDALFKKTGETIELITDIDKFMFFEKGKRGGISMICNRLGQANNYLMGDSYKKNEVDKWISYWDANNLYAIPMNSKLPIGEYKWCVPQEFTQESILQLDDGDYGYVFEVDLKYPIELHDAHNDYPLAPENIKVTKDMLSPYNNQMLELNGLKHVECNKLVPNLMDKKNYITHYKNLQLYLNLGMVLTKVHKVMSFKQSTWMKPYIDFNSDQRKVSKNSFEKDFYKLMNNAVFGKTMEDVRRHMEAHICLNMKQKDKMINSPRLQNWTIWGENYGFFELSKSKVELCKPIQVGFTVLELSKVHMYDFHYNYVMKKYGNKAKLLFTDTDSLCYELQTKDLFKDMKEDIHMFDNSDFPKDHYCFDESNKKVIGKFKLETLDKVATEFIGLRSKLYSLQLDDGSDKKTCKGVKKCVKENNITHADYKQTLMTGVKQDRTQRTIRSYDHSVYSIETCKTALSAVNDKKYMINNIEGYSYGHYKISQ